MEHCDKRLDSVLEAAVHPQLLSGAEKLARRHDPRRERDVHGLLRTAGMAARRLYELSALTTIFNITIIVLNKNMGLVASLIKETLNNNIRK